MPIVKFFSPKYSSLSQHILNIVYFHLKPKLMHNMYTNVRNREKGWKNDLTKDGHFGRLFLF